MRILALAIVSAVAVLGAADRKLSGVVTDRTGAAIAEAAVEVFDPGAKTEARTITDKSGKFAIQALPTGAHVVHVEKSGFETEQRPFTLSDNDGFIRVSLRLAKVQYSITVDGGAARLDTASDAHQDAFTLNQTTFADLPVKDGDILTALSSFVNPAGGRADRHRGRHGANRCGPSALFHSGGTHQR